MDDIEQAIVAIKSGKMVIMVDDEDRENEGDLVFAADLVTHEMINFMAKEARGLICLALSEKIVQHLQLPPMFDVRRQKDPSSSTAFTMSIEARAGVTTGISSFDRAFTIKTAIDPNSKPEDLTIPGHVFPLRARSGGVLTRAGHTEGSVDLARLAGCQSAAVICEIMNDNGSMARCPDLYQFAQKHNLPIISIADLIHYRLLREPMVKSLAVNPLMMKDRLLKVHIFKNTVDQSIHFALINQDFTSQDIVDVRVHRQRSFQDIFYRSKHSLMSYNMGLLKQDTPTVLVYLMPLLKPEDVVKDLDAIGEKGSLQNQIQAPMQQKFYGLGAQILRTLHVKKMRIHATTNRALLALKGFQLEIVETRIIPKKFNMYR